MSIRSFSFEEIRSATKDFDEERYLGKGAYGKVYKGFVEEGEDGTKTAVAVKRLYNNTGAEVVQQFKEEVTMLSKLRHCRITSLLGHCDHTHDGIFRELILVYEYMPGGTVADRLYNRSGDNQLPPLSWKERINICIGAAEGLYYLHTGTHLVSRVIHCDMKSSNILLDDNLESKVADFGLSKLTPPDKSYCSTSQQRGTLGYLDPAFRNTKRLTAKSDVYSFGVVLLEMLCGRAAVDPELPREQQNLTKWAKPLIDVAATPTVTENVIRQIVDVSIFNEIKRDCLLVYVKLIKDCLHKDPKKRPTMFDVVARLQRARDLQVDRRVTEIFSDGNHSGDDDGTDSDIQYEVIVRACGGLAGSNLEIIEEENFNGEEGDGRGGNLQQSTNSEYFTAEGQVPNNSPEEPECSDQYKNNVDVIFPPSAPRYLHPSKQRMVSMRIPNVREGGHQYKNNVNVKFPSSPSRFLDLPIAWLTNAVSGMSVDNHIENKYMELDWDMGGDLADISVCCICAYE